ncbi:MAG TPA: hypothetical protein PKE29_01945 [Phycisphaerales bacterium]|nr:hypothetical protein [Phycisphaerales bacterium]
MSVLPEADLATIQFCETHLPVWAIAPATIGLTAGMVSSLQTQTKAARDAYNVAQAARLASKGATTTFHNNTTIMRGTVADMVRLVKAFAENSANPGSVYAAAQIPEPAAPSTPPVPGTPEMVTVGLNPSGSITLYWKATDAAPSSGCTFEVSRRLGTSGTYQIVGVGTSMKAGKFQFTDLTLPFGTQVASYIIVGKRSNPPQTGMPSEAVNVQFGVGMGGGMTITGADGASLKMAA